MKTCFYCKQECGHTICLSCDGKHSGRRIYKLINIEKSIYKSKGIRNVPNDYKLKEFFIKRDILGLEGLTQEDRSKFFGALNYEYNRLIETEERIN